MPKRIRWDMLGSIGVFLATFFYLSVGLANPGMVTLKSALTWRPDEKGDYRFDKESLSLPGSYEIDSAYETEGQIETIIANWKFSGKVTLKVSADNGANYTAIINGLPLVSGFVKGNQLKWRVTLGEDSELREIKLAYTDSLGVVGTFGEPQLSGFKFKKSIYISSVDEELFNYQMKIKVAESEGEESADVDCGRNIQADFKDIRFTAADGETLLSYYLESITGDEPNRIATFWVKIPQIPPEGLPIYMYYSNPGAKDLSNGEDTFDFFDDFSGDNLDLTKWELKQGVYSVFDSQLKLENAEIFSKDYLIKDGIIEYRARADIGNEVRLIARGEKDDLLAGVNQVAYSSNYSGAEHCLAIGDIVRANQSKAITSGASYNYRVILDGANLAFQRYSEDYQELEAEIEYNDENGLSQGSIGVKSGNDCVSYFDWVRVRKYSSYEVAVDKGATQLAAAEQVELPDFYGLTLSENGDLILGEDYVQGRYTSRIVALADEARIFIPSYKITNNGLSTVDNGLSIDVSMDAGGDYATNCVQGDFYYASKDDFTVGNAWKFKLSLQASELIPPQLSEVSVDYRAGRILLITPNDGEIWPPQQQRQIAWSALEYEPSYEMKLEYSLDAGVTYTEITKATKNTGTYLWTVPDAISHQALVRFSDALEPRVFDVSDETFTISAEEAIAEEEMEEEVEGVEAEEAQAEETIPSEQLDETSQQPGIQAYDILVKLGDNHNLDPEEDARACYKEGDIIVVKPAGHKWSDNERNSFLIVQVYLSEEEARQLTAPKVINTGKKNKDGRPIKEIVRIRSRYIDLKKFGLSKEMKEKRSEKIHEIRSIFKDNPLAPELIEEK